MYFTDLCEGIQNKLFYRVKVENVSIENSNYILQEEINNELEEMSIRNIEKYLIDFGFFKALEVCDESYGLSALEDMDKVHRIHCILFCVIRDSFSLNDMEESYKKWCENGEGEGQCETTN
jgi:hypothetical protein